LGKYPGSSNAGNYAIRARSRIEKLTRGPNTVEIANLEPDSRRLDERAHGGDNLRRLRESAMHQDWKFWAPFLAAVSAIIVAVVASYVGGFLGILIAGLAITFAAIRYDLEKSDVGGGFPSPTLYARQVSVRENMPPDERNAYRANLHALWRPLFVGKTIGVGLILLGLGGFLLL